MRIGEIHLDHLLIAFVLSNDILQICDGPSGVSRFVIDVIDNTLFEDMDLLFALVLGCVVDFAKGSGTGLLINGHDLVS
jgi:hypothetical protein